MGVLPEIAGWTGAVAILAAYLFVSMGWIRPDWRFQAGNLIGASAFIINGATHGAWPSVVTNIAWFLISIFALVRKPKAQPLATVPICELPHPIGTPPITSEIPLQPHHGSHAQRD